MRYPGPAGPSPSSGGSHLVADVGSSLHDSLLDGSNRGHDAPCRRPDARPGVTGGDLAMAPAMPHQYASAEMTSPPPTLPSARHVGPAIVLLTKWTLPSPNRALTPPGW